MKDTVEFIFMITSCVFVLAMPETAKEKSAGHKPGMEESTEG